MTGVGGAAGTAVATRTLRVAQLVTTLARGGAQATVLGALDVPGEAGEAVEVTVLAGRDDPGEGTHWAELLASGARVVPVGPLHRSVRPVADVAALWWLIRWLRAERPDVLHTHSSKAGVIGRLAAAAAGVPVVHTVHGWSYVGLTTGRGRRGRLVRWAVIALERWLARWTRALVVVTPLDAERGLGDGIGRPDQYRVVRSGIDLNRPRSGRAARPDLRRQQGWSDRFVVGVVSRLVVAKGIDTLVMAFARTAVPGGVLVVVGDGPDRPRLEQLAVEAGLGPEQVRFLGARDDAAHLVAAFDLFALPSHWEGLPRTLVEAVAAEVPVVATAVGGIPELIRPGRTGTLVPVGDPAALAAVLAAAAADPGPFRAMAERAARAAEDFSVEAMRLDLAQVWRDAAGWPAR